jgi:hypothetical protein
MTGSADFHTGGKCTYVYGGVNATIKYVLDKVDRRWKGASREPSSEVSSATILHALSTRGKLRQVYIWLHWSPIFYSGSLARDLNQGRIVEDLERTDVTRWLCPHRFLPDAQVPGRERRAAVIRNGVTPTKINVVHNPSQ